MDITLNHISKYSLKNQDKNLFHNFIVIFMCNFTLGSNEVVISSI